MDEFINSYVSSPVWPDTISSRSSWDGTLACQTSGLIDDSLETYGHGNNQIARILPPDDIIGNTTDEDLNLHRFNGAKSFFTDGNTKFEDEKGLGCGERSSHHSLGDQTLQQNLVSKDTFVRNCSLQGVIGDTPAAKPFNSAIAHNSMTICNSIPNNENDLSNFSQVLGDANPFNSFPPIWPPSYSGVSSFRGQSKLQGFGFGAGESSDDVLMKTCIDDIQLNSFSAVFLHQNDQNGLQSFSAGQQISLMSGDLQHEKVRQFSTSSDKFNTTNQIHNSGTQAQTTPTNTNGCNGATKPRVRARRGQATDPHSIAERLRREKIAERMRNLQELVPSSNKTDKASMLDEIIDYVKFLQLQVKVLSMSRLGAAGAVLPLLANTQTEGSGSILVPSSAGEGVADILESEDCLAFEQEVVKLMESNVTSAIQYLQNKGLCLMPIALATAISRQKGSSTAIPPDHQKVRVFSVGSHNHIEASPDSGANSCNGTTVKQEESQKRFES